MAVLATKEQLAMVLKDWSLDPDSIWHASGLGREEFVQRLMSALIYGRIDYRRNTPGVPSDRGRRYLSLLAERHFGSMLPETDQFIDEFELPRRHDDERAG